MRTGASYVRRSDHEESSLWPPHIEISPQGNIFACFLKPSFFQSLISFLIVASDSIKGTSCRNHTNFFGSSLKMFFFLDIGLF